MDLVSAVLGHLSAIEIQKKKQKDRVMCCESVMKQNLNVFFILFLPRKRAANLPLLLMSSATKL